MNKRDKYNMSERDRYNLTVVNLIKSAMAQDLMLSIAEKNGVTEVVIFWRWGVYCLGRYSQPGTNLEDIIRGAMEVAKANGNEIRIPKRK